MKKRLLIAFLVIAIIICIGITIISIDIDAASQKGHRLYDPTTGEVNGCQSPGSDCTYSY